MGVATVGVAEVDRRRVAVANHLTGPVGAPPRPFPPPPPPRPLQAAAVATAVGTGSATATNHSFRTPKSSRA